MQENFAWIHALAVFCLYDDYLTYFCFNLARILNFKIVDTQGLAFQSFVIRMSCIEKRSQSFINWTFC